MSIRIAALIASVIVLGVVSAASAQTSSYYGGTQTSGLFGSNTLGGASSTNSGQSLSGGSSNSLGAATTSAQPNVAMGAQNIAASASQNTRQQTVGAFVGADSADNQNFLSRQGVAGAAGQGGQAGRGGGLDGLSQLQNLFSQNQQGFNGQNQTQSMPQIRIALRLGFRPQPISPTRMQTFETRLTRLPGMRFVGSPEVVMEGRTAILRGTVASEEDRDLAEALAKMEPDVLKVRNELVVADTPEASPETLPAVPAATP
jgi:hypothetical protein